MLAETTTFFYFLKHEAIVNSLGAIESESSKKSSKASSTLNF
jgi:hypothetical protein